MYITKMNTALTFENFKKNCTPIEFFCLWRSVLQRGGRHNATHRNTPQHTATHCNTLQHTTSCLSQTALQPGVRHTTTHCNTLQRTTTHWNTLEHTTTHSNILQHTATYCNTLQSALCSLCCDKGVGKQQHTATHCNTLQHTATHCNTLQHTATPCNLPFAACAAARGSGALKVTVLWFQKSALYSCDRVD